METQTQEGDRYFLRDANDGREERKKKKDYLWGWLPWQFFQVFKMTLAPLVCGDELQWFLVAPNPLTEGRNSHHFVKISSFL